ncbi:MAG: helix-turn-helix domain-containing protein [Alphaproteobacteria bacterium]|nr:helix-turn-helix domain-containing protein [Alphaproteobacteria bacterium]
MEERHINVFQLAKRWGMSPKTLDRWRWQGIGPKFLKIGSKVVYRLSDIEEYEVNNLKTATDKDKSISLLGNNVAQAV